MKVKVALFTLATFLSMASSFANDCSKLSGSTTINDIYNQGCAIRAKVLKNVFFYGGLSHYLHGKRLSAVEFRNLPSGRNPYVLELSSSLEGPYSFHIGETIKLRCENYGNLPLLTVYRSPKGEVNLFASKGYEEYHVNVGAYVQATKNIFELSIVEDPDPSPVPCRGLN